MPDRHVHIDKLYKHYSNVCRQGYLGSRPARVLSSHQAAEERNKEHTHCMNDLVHMDVHFWNQLKPRIYTDICGPFSVKSSYLNKKEMRGKCNNSLENTQSSSPGAGFKRKKAL